MQWGELDSDACSIARAMGVLGDRWTVLVLRDVFNGVRRFDDLASHLGIARDVLTKRLAGLVAEGVLERVPYREPGTRTRHEYRLTAAGRELRPVLLALLSWGDAHRAGPEGGPVTVVHEGCGAPVRPVLECAAGHRMGAETRIRSVPRAARPAATG